MRQMVMAGPKILFDANGFVIVVGLFAALVAGFWLFGFVLGLANLLGILLARVLAVPFARSDLAPTLTYAYSALGVGFLLFSIFV